VFLCSSLSLSLSLSRVFLFLEQKTKKKGAYIFKFLGFRVYFLKHLFLSLVSKHHTTNTRKHSHKNIYTYKKMSYNFGNDGATQFQGGDYGYAHVYVLFASVFSLSR